MKLQSFCIISIFICLYITIAPTIEELDLAYCNCKIWAEDSNHTRIGGDSSYHSCTFNTYTNYEETFNFPDQTYSVHAKVQGSFEKTKNRGPFNDTTCFRIHGSVDKWKFDNVPCN
ncbi:hypothetical protein F8M41_020056 [Gigaspora margarita]|uniref:Secreted protein n=1 Tax=Gigaspora margarita TaxID=4874 RepID=A0A8H4AJ32_GIGMA|nr:hypothetical protein F8M41_020056 [Gigaspora margarita]